jgi:hypothetical protein
VPYVVVVATVHGQHGLVMFAYDGLLESAFVVERPERGRRTAADEHGPPFVVSDEQGRPPSE